MAGDGCLAASAAGKGGVARAARPMRNLVLLLFFVSGLTSLVYEVVWERLLHLAFGLSTYSVAAVTAAFMLGLALGYFAGKSRLVGRWHPLLVYGLAEAAIGGLAVLFLRALPIIDALHAAAGGAFLPKFLLAFGLLVLPTTLMGLTLPVLARYVVVREGVGARIGLLYGVNTFGGAVGILVCGLVLIRVLGVTATTLLAASLNLGVGLASFALWWRVRAGLVPEDSRRRVEGAGEPGAGSSLPFVALAFLLGANALALEVVWTRTLVCVVSNNTYAFAIVVASVLSGIGLGAGLYGLVGARVTGGRARALLFWAVMLAAGTHVALCVPLLNLLYDVAQFYAGVIGVGTWWKLAAVRFLSAGAVTLVPAIASGFALPLLIDLAHDRTLRPASWLSASVFSANTLGAVVGALGAGFGLVPAWGMTRTLGASGAAYALAGLVPLWTAAPGESLRSGRRRIAGVAAAAAVAGVALMPGQLTLTRWYDGLRRIRGDLVFYREGVFGTIGVYRVGGIKELTINCIEEVPSHRDALLNFKLLAHVPLLLHGAPHRVLVNAVGAGITLGAVLRHEVEAEGVDIVPAVVEVLPLFADENGALAEREDWRFITDDGRNHLRLTPNRYDVITADATHPAAAESWTLYTREYYDLVRSRLEPGGIFAQWLPLHGLAPSDYLAVLKTFRTAFAEMLVLFVNRYTILIGGTTPLGLNEGPEEITRRINRSPAVRRDLESLGIRSGSDLLRYVMLDAAAVGSLPLEDVALLTDDKTSLEFAEFNRLGLAAALPAILRRLLPYVRPAELAARFGVDGRVYAARRHLMGALAGYDVDSLDAVFSALKEVDKGLQLSPGDADLEDFRARAAADLLRIVGARYQQLLDRSPPETLLAPFRYAAALRAQDPFFLELVGATYLRLQRWEGALPFLEEAAARRPTDLSYLSNLAYAYGRLGRPEDALRVLRRADGISPGQAYIREAIEEAQRQLRAKEGAAGAPPPR